MGVSMFTAAVRQFRISSSALQLSTLRRSLQIPTCRLSTHSPRELSASYAAQINKRRRPVPVKVAGFVWRDLVDVCDVGRLKRSSGVVDVKKLFESGHQEDIRNADIKNLVVHFDARNFRSSRYFKAWIRSVENNELEKLSKEELNVLLFAVYVNGFCPEAVLTFLESSFEQHVQTCSWIELSIFSLAFFRANRPIRNYGLLRAMSVRILNDSPPQVQPIYLVNILKALRHADFQSDSFYEGLGRKSDMLQTWERKHFTSVVHVLSTYATMKFYQEDLLRNATKTLLTHLSDSSWVFRVKDLGRILWSLGTLQYRTDESMRLVDACLSEVLSKMRTGSSELQKFPEAFVDAALGSAYLGVFPHELFTCCLSQGFRDRLADSPQVKKREDLLILDFSIGIEEGEAYTGNRLPESFLTELSNYAFGFSDLELATRPGLLATREALKRIVGEENVCCNFLLPHFKTLDLYLMLNEEGTPVAVPSSWDLQHQRSPLASVLPALSAGHGNRVALVLYGRKQYAKARGADLRLLGLPATKIRQLRKLGFTVYLVDPAVSQNIHETYQRGDQSTTDSLVRQSLTQLGIRLS